MDKKKASLYSPLALAYIGDGVYELFIRTKVLQLNPDMPAYKLHKATVEYVKAQAQSNAIGRIEELLTQTELSVYKRGRNAKSSTVPKNQDVADYRRATGFEALIGYLYLNNEEDRLNELMEESFNSLNNM